MNNALRSAAGPSAQVGKRIRRFPFLVIPHPVRLPDRVVTLTCLEKIRDPHVPLTCSWNNMLPLPPLMGRSLDTADWRVLIAFLRNSSERQ